MCYIKEKMPASCTDLCTQVLTPLSPSTTCTLNVYLSHYRRGSHLKGISEKSERKRQMDISKLNLLFLRREMRNEMNTDSTSSRRTKNSCRWIEKKISFKGRFQEMAGNKKGGSKLVSTWEANYKSVSKGSTV